MPPSFVTTSSIFKRILFRLMFKKVLLGLKREMFRFGFGLDGLFVVNSTWA